MPELEIGLAVLAFVAFGFFLGELVRQLPRLWSWFRFKVWYDYRYAQGYRKGLAHGRIISRRDDSE